MRQVLTYALGGDPSSKSTVTVNGKSIFCSVADKVRRLRNAVAEFFAPREIEEFSLAIA